MRNHRVVVSAHGGPEVLQPVEEELPRSAVGPVRYMVMTVLPWAWPAATWATAAGPSSSG